MNKKEIVSHVHDDIRHVFSENGFSKTLEIRVVSWIFEYSSTIAVNDRYNEWEYFGRYLLFCSYVNNR